MRRLAPILALLILAAAAGLWWVSRGPEPVRHTVARGDTLWAIAKQHGVTVDELREWNAIEGDRIEVGQELLVWTEPPAEAAGAPVTARKRGRARSSGQRRQSGQNLSASKPAAAPEGALALPPEEPCLAGPSLDDDGGDEAAFAASAGLGRAAVKAAMDAAIPSLYRCMPEGAVPEGTLDLEITVACTGRVARVDVLDDGGLPADFTGCVRQTLGYADFPAHDMPDGFTFGYPLTVGM